MPACSSSFGTANTGPMPISSGSQPATAKPRKMPSGFRPLARRCLVAHHDADAGAVGELAGVAGRDHAALDRRLDLRHALVGGVGADAFVLRTRSLPCVESAPVALSTTFIVVVIGTISSLNLPAARAAAARCWLRTPYWSCCSREMLVALAPRTRRSAASASRSRACARCSQLVAEHVLVHLVLHARDRFDAAGRRRSSPSPAMMRCAAMRDRLQARRAEAVDRHARHGDRAARRASRSGARCCSRSRLRGWRSP